MSAPMFPFTRAWLFVLVITCIKEQMNRNLTISRLDYREDDRRGEWEGGRGNFCVLLFLQIWYDTAVCWAEMKMFPGFDWQTEDRMVCILSVNIYTTAASGLSRCNQLPHMHRSRLVEQEEQLSLTIVHTVWPENCRSWLCSLEG